MRRHLKGQMELARIAELEAEVERLKAGLGETEQIGNEAHNNRVAVLQTERDEVQSQLRAAEGKAEKSDQWFEKGRCPACHFEEKHMASCPIRSLEGTIAALGGLVLEFHKVLNERDGGHVAPELCGCMVAEQWRVAPEASKAILAAAKREQGLTEKVADLEAANEKLRNHDADCEIWAALECDCGFARVSAALALRAESPQSGQEGEKP